MELPEALLRDAQQVTGEGVTETVRRGLRLVAAGKAYQGIRRLRGKVRFSMDLEELRADRR
jgi:hypothetical protein